MKNKFTEMRKLIAMSLIVLVLAIMLGINLFGWMIFVGSVLMLEHLIVYGRFDFFDFLGHEWVGLILISIPLIWIGLWGILALIVLAFLLACGYSWTEKLDPFNYAINKLRFWK